ncbi:Uncharacterised protein [Mycobacterium tuberculosis]|uniref:Uncharacterized protein n=1 Tax=Mycobacterium tuberculosis TaxID=1773 RepID=A0A916LHB3_MYCTX|nr:Uncharacterised protein [Mycobacterium tuberculosis]
MSANTCGFRVAAALASRVPHSCSWSSTLLRVIELRFSLMSLAYSGSAALSFSILIDSRPTRSRLGRSLEEFASV